MGCLVMTPELAELKGRLQGERDFSSDRMFLTYVKVWRKENGKDDDVVPDAGTLVRFRDELYSRNYARRFAETFESDGLFDSVRGMPRITRDFRPDVLARRVETVARLFTDVLDNLVEEREVTLERMIAEAEDPGARAELEQRLDNLTRMGVLNEVTPKGVFLSVYRMFDPESVTVENELANIMNTADGMAMGEADRVALAERKAGHKREEYAKIRDNFGAISELAGATLKRTENIVISPRYVNAEETDESGLSGEAAFDPESAERDGWMDDVQTITGTQSLSRRSRSALMDVELTDRDGRAVRDDLDMVVHVSVDNVVGTLFDALTDMIDSDDFMPLLRRAAVGKPWISQVVRMCEADDRLRTILYRDLCKDFVHRTAQRTDAKDGARKVVELNMREGARQAIGQADTNFENGRVLDPASFTVAPGEASRERARGSRGRVAALIDEVARVTEISENGAEVTRGARSGEKILQIVNGGRVSELASLIRGIGVEISDSELMSLLESYGIDQGWAVSLDGSPLKPLSLTKRDYKDSMLAYNRARRIAKQRGEPESEARTTGDLRYDPIGVLLGALYRIYGYVADGQLDPREGETARRPGSLFKADIRSVASVLQSVFGPTGESSVHEAGKTYSSRVQVSRLGRLIKQLSDAIPDKAISDEDRAAGYTSYFDKFVRTEYGQDFFYSNGEWRCGWLRELVENAESRRHLAMKNVLHLDGVGYEKWSAAQYQSVSLKEWDEQDDGAGYRWFAVPVRSNMKYADYIRFRTFFDGRDDAACYDDFHEALVGVVMQEVGRIGDVMARSRVLADGSDQSIAAIAGYDITYGKDGEVRSVGGAEFKFLPMLNDMYVEDGGDGTVTAGSVAHGDEISEDRRGLMTPLLRWVMDNSGRAGRGGEIHAALRGAVEKAVDRMFGRAMEEWEAMGLFDTDGRRNVWLPSGFGGGVTMSDVRSRKIEALEAGREQMTAAGLWTADMERLLDMWRKGMRPDDEASLVGSFLDALGRLAERGAVRTETVERLRGVMERRYVAEDALRRFFCDSLYAQMQIDQLTIGDPAFFQNVTQKQKRYKMMSAPGVRLDPNATFRGQRVGTTHDTSIILSDRIDVSEELKGIEKVMDEAVKSGRMTPLERDFTVSQLKRVNWTDGQSFRTLPSLRKMLIMEGDEIWNDRMEQAYNNVVNGTWSFSDLHQFFTVRKPFIATQHTVTSLDGRTIKVPVMVKTSEAVLMSIYPMVTKGLNSPSALRALNRFMVDNGIDSANFESGVKSGAYGVVDINGIDGEEAIIRHLEAVTGVRGERNPNVLHSTPYEDFVEQQFVREQTMDEELKSGRQFRRLMLADIPYGSEITMPDGRRLTRNQLHRLYNGVITQNILDEFEALGEEFKDIRRVAEIMQDSVRKSNFCTPELLKAVTLRKGENGRPVFNVAPFDPVISDTMQRVANAYVRRRLLDTSDRRRGGRAVQVSSWGLSKSLKVHNENGVTVFECLISNYSADLFRDYSRKVSRDGREFWEIQLDKVPEKLLRAIGYRIPTEGRHSMMALRIVGFLPAQMGSAIMLPPEITTFADSDFDVDEVTLTFYESERMAERHKEGAYGQMAADRDRWIERYKSGDEYSKLETKPSDDELKRRWEARHLNDMKYVKWYRQKVVEFDWKKTIKENTRQQRNNLLMDIEWAVLTSPVTAARTMKKSGLHIVKDAAYICNILRNVPEADIRSALGDKSGRPVVELLQECGGPRLKDLRFDLVRDFEPYSPVTQVMLQQLNMSGNDLIGAYAVNNTSHATLQYSRLRLKPPGQMVLNGNRALARNAKGEPYWSLHEMRNARGEWISDNMTGFCAASVDNGKELLLEDLNQTIETVSMSTLMLRLGYDPLEIGLFFNQPVMREISRELRRPHPGKSMVGVIDEVAARYVALSKANSDRKSMPFEWRSGLDNAEMAEALMKGRELSRPLKPGETRSFNVGDFYNMQAYVAKVARSFAIAGEDLSTLTQTLRPDSTGQGTTIAETLKKILDRRRLRQQSSTLVGADNVLLYGEVVESAEDSPDLNFLFDTMQDDVNGVARNPAGFINTTYMTAVEGASRTLGRYFPYFREDFRETLYRLDEVARAKSLDVKTIDDFLKQYVTYWLTGIESLGGTAEADALGERFAAGELTPRGVREMFINRFADYFSMMRSKRGIRPELTGLLEAADEISRNGFVRMLRVQDGKTKDDPRVVTLDYANMSRDDRDFYTREWERMLHSENEHVRKFAENLFRYDFFRAGLSFSPTSYGYLAPVALRQGLRGYADRLESLNDGNTAITLASDGVDNDFLYQFMLNNTDNASLWATSYGTTNVRFARRDGSLEDVVRVSFDGRAPNSEGDAGFVKDKFYVPQVGTCYVFNDFVKREVNGRECYYVLDADRSDDWNAVYMRAERLGSKDTFFEYEMGAAPHEISSVIGANARVRAEARDAGADAQGRDTMQASYEEYMRSRGGREDYGDPYAEPNVSGGNSFGINLTYKGSEERGVDDQGYAGDPRRAAEARENAERARRDEIDSAPEDGYKGDDENDMFCVDVPF